jgi:hypothetical protein
MFPRSMLFSRAVVAGAVVLATGSALQAQLASRSPFLPPQSAAPNAPTADAPLEVGGYLDTPGDGRLYRVIVKDPSKKSAVWVKLNELNKDLDVTVKQHDDEQQTLTVEHGGKTLTLAEKKAKIVASGAAQPMPPPPAPPPANVPPAVTQAVVLNPTPADEQKRLEAVAAEVARRRALREQASQQINQPPQPVPQVAPQQPRMPAPTNQRPALPITRQR